MKRTYVLIILLIYLGAGVHLLGTQEGSLTTSSNRSNDRMAKRGDRMAEDTEDQEVYQETTQIAHSVSPSLIIYPSNHAIISGAVTLAWEAVSDTFAHRITYLIYFSSIENITWELIVSLEYFTNYNWNTYAVPDGSYQLKIVARCIAGMTTEMTSYFTINNSMSTPDLMTRISLLAGIFLLLLFILKKKTS
ncbi:hypothetical protein CEE45_16220 [Candidatus Heimdallarchaeota archaeon B3_Heim]|nr:MAG: hypothetical protein CEE45_16220 [Candidatus Heimdallarchaeota archaeon B3_Heim]